jgi:GNAT superfamily N-acetyltransferase
MSALIFRDGLEEDIPACLEIDHTYANEYVWQMNISELSGSWQIGFRTDRLPRQVEMTYPADEARLRVCLSPEHCFVVAAERSSSDLLAYLTMRHDPIRSVVWVHDIVVDRELRRHGIGTRLLKIARQWAVEKQARRLISETQTKNYPAINFCLSSGLVFCGYNDHYLENQDIAVFFGQTLR